MLSIVSFMVLTNNKGLLKNWVNEWSLKDTLGHGADFRPHWIIHAQHFYKSGHMISRSRREPIHFIRIYFHKVLFIMLDWFSWKLTDGQTLSAGWNGQELYTYLKLLRIYVTGKQVTLHQVLKIQFPPLSLSMCRFIDRPST